LASAARYQHQEFKAAYLERMEQIARDVYAHSVAELAEFNREAGQASNCW
jgi:hypothetical protein